MLSISFIGTIRGGGEEFITALITFNKQIVFFVIVISHPSRIITSTRTTIHVEVGEVIIRTLIGAHVPCFIFSVWSYNASCVRAICSCWIPHIAAIFSVIEKVITFVTIGHHPIFIPETVNTV